MAAQYPSGVYNPPADGLPYVGVVVVSPADVRIRHFMQRDEAVRFVEGEVAALMLGRGETRQ